ncbi:MAG: aldehyde dehydrogenase family protein, partial [Chitinophagaceae bacterium]|nr:aldehyde dehydrogenase family protein [Chitinophagaceae bacterium]
AIVEADADLQVAARRIAVTKFSNAGQMCIAPDYVLVHRSKKAALVEALKNAIRQFYSEDPSTDYSYGKIINQRQFTRIQSYLGQGKILHGGKTDSRLMYIEPTIMGDVPLDAPLMQEEIFGPILPVLGFEHASEALQIIEKNPEPLALYLFTRSKKKEDYYLGNISFGGGCINNTSWHFTNPYLPFGGRGGSGIGAYHGRTGFDTFTHRKSIMKTPLWFDPSLKYPPFKGKLNLFKKIIR